MKKAEVTLIGWIIAISVIAYPFVWLHEKIGWLGIGIIGAILFGLAII